MARDDGPAFFIAEADDTLMEQTDIFGDFTVTTIITAPPWYENCYLVQHQPTDDQLVIDPGSDGERIVEMVNANGGALKAIWITHGHPDHVGGARGIQDALGVQCHAHQEEAPVVTQVAEWAMAMIQVRMEAPKDLVFFNGEPALDFAGTKVQTVFTPGHTPGGVCYVFDGFAFTGDTLFNHGVGRTDFPGGDGRQLSESITNLLGVVPEETMLYSGHGPAWPAGEASRWWKAMF